MSPSLAGKGTCAAGPKPRRPRVAHHDPGQDAAPTFLVGGLGAQELMEGGVARARGQPRGDQLAEAGACVLGVGETWGDDTPEAPNS